MGIGNTLRRDAPRKPMIKKELLVGGFLIGIMVLSSFAFILEYYGGDTANTVTYGNHTFKASKNGWQTKINGALLEFYYTPETVADLNISAAAPVILKSSRVLWITYDPNSEYSDVMGGIQYEDDILLSEGLKIYTQRGLTNNTDYPDLPLVDCANATAYEPVLLLKQTNETITEITTQGNCVILSAQFGDDMIRLNERLMYTALGVIP